MELGLRDDEIERLSLRRLEECRRHRWELEKSRDARLAGMLARAVALWVPAGQKPPQPDYYAPWAAPRRAPRAPLTPEDLYHRMVAWTAVSGGTPPPRA